MRFRNGLVSASLLGLTILTSGCWKQQEPAPAAIDVGVIKLAGRHAEVTTDYVGQTISINTVEIRPRVGGILERQATADGDRVTQGQLLFIIDQQPYKAALAQAQAALAQADANLAQSRRDLARVKPLSTIDAVSQQELDAAIAKNDANKALLDAAQAQVTTAELNLGYTTITSPNDGVMGRALLRVGGLVTAYSTLVTTVYSTDPMYVDFSISEQRLLDIQREQGRSLDQSQPPDRTFRIILSDGSEYIHPARLDYIDPAVDTRTGTLLVRLKTSNAEGLLRAGQFARVQVTLQTYENAILVPQRAIQELQGSEYVWIVDADGKAQQRTIKVGPLVGTDQLIEQGLAAGDEVVIDGVQRMRPGVSVQTHPVQPVPPPGGPTPAKGAADKGQPGQ